MNSEELEKAADDYATSNSIDQHTSIELYRSEQDEAHQYAKSVFIAGAEWQSNQSPWISVEDRLPENDEAVLISSQIYGKAVLRWNGSDMLWMWEDSDEFYCERDKIDAWMPIPE